MKETPPSPPLELATIEEIVEELGRRSRAFVLAVLTESKNDPRYEDFRNFYGGGYTTAWGIVVRATEQFREQAGIETVEGEE